MSEIERIKSVVAEAARRRRLQNGLHGLWKGFLIGSAIWVAAEICYRLAPLPPLTSAAAQSVLAGCALIGFLIGWSRRVTLQETARWIDMKERLQERLSTALEVSESSPPGRWRDLIVADAAAVLGQIKAKSLLPYHLPRAASWTLLVLLLGAGMAFVPPYRSKAFVQKKQDAEIIKETGKQLAELTRRNIARRPPALEPTRKALESVSEVGDHLSKATLTRSDALKDLASVTEKLKAEARELGNNAAFKSMERANQASQTGGTPGNADLQKQIESLQKSLGAMQPPDSKELDEFKEDLQKAIQAAADLPNGNTPEAHAARQQLSEALAKLAQQAKDLGLELPTIEDAISALAASETGQVLRDLKIAENSLEKLQAMAKALAQLQAQAEKIGKDLAEQLANGQAEIAKQTIEEMMNKLSQSELSQEELQNLAEAADKAAKPGQNFGKTGDHLKAAAQQMKNGDKSGAAQSLAAAASELNSLMQQMEDVKSLMAALESLQAAQMSVANGMGWNQSRTDPKAGKGQGIGSGVGTWADDSVIMDISDIRDRWDNSGVVRPDEEARGNTDRGDGQLADNLAPTKVKGQMNPNAPMPSITLKGVSIKGVSKVDFKEIATAAQSDAQSALSQEQVPRAYQGAVRDYFDDLKQ